MNDRSMLPFDDLQTMRIRCHHRDCLAVTELRLPAVEGVMKKTGSCCPVCGKPFTSPAVEGGADVVTQMAKALIALHQLGDRVGLEFSLPGETG